VGRSWEGAQPVSQPTLASGNIPCHGCHAQFMNGGKPGSRNFSPFFLWVQILFWLEFKLFQEFGLFGELCKILAMYFCRCIG